MQQDPSLLPSESSPDGSHQERHHHPHLLPSSPRHLGSPETSDCSTETDRRGTGASTPDISVSSDSEFESWDDGLFFKDGLPFTAEVEAASGSDVLHVRDTWTVCGHTGGVLGESWSLNVAVAEWTLWGNVMQEQHALKKAPWHMTLTVTCISLLTMTQHCW